MLKDKQPMIHDWSHKQNVMTHTTQALRDRKGQVEQQASVDRLVRVDLTVSSGFGGGHSRIPNNQRNSNTVFMRKPPVGQSVFGMMIPIVGRKDNHRILDEVLTFQLLYDLATGRVDFGRHAAHVFHHGLVQCIRLVAFLTSLAWPLADLRRIC